MNKLLIEQYKKITTMTVNELENRIRYKGHQIKPDKQSKHHQYNHTDDLKVISPFYQRKIQHKSNCKCKYHRKIQNKIKKIIKYETQPNENVCLTLAHLHSHKCQEQTERKPIIHLKAQQNNRKPSLKSQFAKRQEKTASKQKLDCHNVAFQQFLKDSNLVLLSKPKTSQKLMGKGNLRTLQKVFTQGNIHTEHSKSQLSSSSREDPSMNETIKLKKIGFKGTGLELIDEEVIHERPDDLKRKRAKFMTNRPSFFGNIEDQEILREICQRFMHEDNIENEQGRQMLRQLVDSDIDIYKKVLDEMEDDIEEGIKIGNLQGDHANMLVKIVLQKIRKEAKNIKTKDQQYLLKNQLIEVLCNKFGWSKDDKGLGLRQFWKISKSEEKINPTRKSILLKSKNVIQRRKSFCGEAPDDSRQRSNVTIKQFAKEGSGKSGFATDKSCKNSSKNSHTKLKEFSQKAIQMVSTSSFANIEREHDKQIAKQAIDKAKANTAPVKITKNGALMRGHRVGRKTKIATIAEEPSQIINIIPVNDESVSRQPCPLPIVNEAGIVQDDRAPTLKIIEQPKDELQENASEGASSCFIDQKKNHVQHHIERNKRFLRKIQRQLTCKDCNELIICMEDSILTKRRKIRAMNIALQQQEIKKSENYQDLIKYVEIYQKYCNLVIKNKQKQDRASLQRQENMTFSNSEKHKSTNRKTQMFEFMDENVTQKKQEQIQIDTLLEDLKKQRQLKYISIKMITDIQDPKQELILKIPQSTTKRINDANEEVLPNNLICQPVQKSCSQQKHKYIVHKQWSHPNKDNCLQQKNLEEKVNLTYGPTAELPQEKEECTPEHAIQIIDYTSKLERQLKNKLQRYRRLLRVSVGL